MDMITVIRFTRNRGPYSPGDSAGFADAQAQAYIDAGVAELVLRPDAAGLDAAPPAGEPAEATSATTRKSRARS